MIWSCTCSLNLLSTNPRSFVFDNEHESSMFDVEAFGAWLHQTISCNNARSVIRAVRKLHAGESVQIAQRTYEPLVGVHLTPDMVDRAMCDAARDWAPRGRKNSETLVDASNGWSLHHPLRKMLQYKVEVLQPKRERDEAVVEGARALRSMESLSTAHVTKRRKTWKVSAHVAHNAEQVSSSAPFLQACLKHARANGYEWKVVEEYPFGNRQRCDILLRSGALHVVVESKTHNLLHGLGQVLHYHELAMRDVPTYADGRRYLMVVLACAPRPLELETARKLGVDVWWPEGHPLFSSYKTSHL